MDGITASVFYRRVHCPGSWQLECKIPEIQTEEAIEGSKLHELMLCPAESVPHHLQADVGWAWSRASEILAHFGEPKAVYQEEWLYYHGAYCGRADYLAVFPDKVVILDWKFGRHLAEGSWGEENYQISMLALGAAERFTVEMVAGALVYPRLRLSSPIFTYGKEEIERVKKLYRTVFEACVAKEPPKKVGKWCQFCKAKHICPEFAKEVNELCRIR